VPSPLKSYMFEKLQEFRSSNVFDSQEKQRKYNMRLECMESFLQNKGQGNPFKELQSVNIYRYIA
jgi:hypothetical protein